MSSLQSSEGDIWAEEDSPYFKDVDLQSLVAPTDRKLYVMYHGTTVKRAEGIIRNEFKRSEGGMLGPGVYVSRAFEKAICYPRNMQGKNVVLKLRVNVGRVKRIDRQGHPLQKSWHRDYDSAWVPPNCGMVPSGLEEDCISNPSRIKVIDVVTAPHGHLERLKQLIQNKPMSYRQSYEEDICAEEDAPYFQDVLQSLAAPIDRKPYVMYHGTTVEEAEGIIRNGFICSKDGMLGNGVTVSRAIEKAISYPLNMQGKNVILKLSVKSGMVKSELEDCISNPTRIKVINVVSAPPGHLERLKQLVQNKA